MESLQKEFSTPLRKMQIYVICFDINFNEIKHRLIAQGLTTFLFDYFEVPDSFFFIFPSRWLSVTFDIQNELKMKHL